MDDIADPPDPVLAVLSHYDEATRLMLLDLRALIFEVADEEKVGPLEETLKWGQPAYLCKAGTTIRIDRDDSYGGNVALYVNCRTTLVDSWRERFADLTFGGTRSLHLKRDDDFGDVRLKICIAEALTYRRTKAPV